MSNFLEMLSGISPILVCLLVCVAKIVEITIQSLKTCMMLKQIRVACDNKVFVVASEVSKYAGGYGMVK